MKKPTITKMGTLAGFYKLLRFAELRSQKRGIALQSQLPTAGEGIEKVEYE